MRKSTPVKINRKYYRQCAMCTRFYIALSVFALLPAFVSAQKAERLVGTMDPEDADGEYIGRFEKPNEIRGFFRVQNTRTEFGSTKESSRISRRGYFKNTTDQVGLGFSYKVFGADISFSLPNQRRLDSNLQDLKQVKLGFSFVGRKFFGRVYLNNSKGLVVSDPLKRFQSQPDVKMFKTGAQAIYIVNHSEYSLRSSLLQTEIQRKTAGSVLVRGEIFYHNLNAGSGLVAPDKDLPGLYGDQAGLEYVRGPGIILTPGYGMNFSFFDGQLYVAPMAFLGAGMVYNFYRGMLGSHNKANLVISGMTQLNFGYNNPFMYANFSVGSENNYMKLNPSFLSNTDFKFNLTLGFRFGDLEETLPTSLPEKLF